MRDTLSNNTVYDIFELNPNHFNVRSFYHKAYIVMLGNRIRVLKSYDTFVACEKEGKLYRMWDGYSNTTWRHITEFYLTYSSGNRLTMGDWNKLPMTKIRNNEIEVIME